MPRDITLIVSYGPDFVRVRLAPAATLTSPGLRGAWRRLSPRRCFAISDDR